MSWDFYRTTGHARPLRRSVKITVYGGDPILTVSGDVLAQMRPECLDVEIAADAERRNLLVRRTEDGSVKLIQPTGYKQARCSLTGALKQFGIDPETVKGEHPYTITESGDLIVHLNGKEPMR